MEHGLTIKPERLMALATEQGMTDALKPLSREIHLFDTFVAGTSRLKDPVVLDSIQIGDRLFLQREESKFDDFAIVVLTKNKNKIGYIPEKDNTIFARLMDAGKMIGAKIQKVEKRNGIAQIGIGIFLIDF